MTWRSSIILHCCLRHSSGMISRHGAATHCDCPLRGLCTLSILSQYNVQAVVCLSPYTPVAKLKRLRQGCAVL
jgi:hypothetical protein